ncbi:uncharacterized protein [Amphiura filiformis]|uniref:uncharacterized protein n=1 Tax=Amphiura filiformis TaxID=82378 RepID=UPI003B2257B5
MSDQSKKRCPSSEDRGSLHPPKKSKLQESSSSTNETKEKSKPRTQSEYSDTGWLNPSEFAKIGGDTIRQQLGLNKRPEEESQSIDPQKDCEEAVRLLSEFSQKALSQTGNSKFGLSDTSSEIPMKNIQTINKQDLASLSCIDSSVANSEGKQKDANCPQFESPSSLSSPALVIATTPPKKSGIRKRKLQGASATTSQRRSQEKKNRHTTTYPQNTSKSSAQGSAKKSDSKSPRKSARLASLDHRISWKKGKKRIKKVKRKEAKTSDESDGEFESSYELAIDSDLEARLEENASKNNLTAINVRSILHHVITNEHVLQMVRNTMQDLEEPPKPGTPEKAPAVYEPKLTRSKLKEVTEKVGGNAVAWPLTPVKNPNDPATQFAEIEFPEDSSEDEDYKPSQEDTTVDESDYESIASSQRSDFGSPCPSTPRSRNESFVDEDDISPHKTTPSTTPTTSQPQPVTKHIPAATVPMGPPLARPRVDRYKDDMKFLQQLGCYDAELKSIQEKIAHRTRSKHPIHQSVEEIEASFMPPDIAHDMYDSEPEDKDDEWVAWLAGLNQPRGPESVEPPDDEQNDPEYNFLAEEEPVDTEDFRDDKAVRVSKKELDELMDELFEANEMDPETAYYLDQYGNEVDLQQAAQAIVPDQYNQPVTLGSMIAQQRQASGSPGASPCTSGGLRGTSSPVKVPDVTGAGGVIIMSDGERQQLQQQMQQHVQLLCQMSVLSRACGNMQKDHVQAKKFLNELDYLGRNFEQAVFGVTAATSTQPLPYYSFFRTCNLQESCDIANEPLPEQESSKTSERHERTMAMPLSAAQVLANSTVFMYPELLPTCKLFPGNTKKLKFTDSEDNLIVFGLDQFRSFSKLEDKMKLIQEHMMPSKTVKSLCLHVKNMSSTRSGDNVIKLYRRFGVINSPPIPCEPVQPGMATVPTQLYENRKPDWLKKYMQILNLKTTEEMLEDGKEPAGGSFQNLQVPPIKQSISDKSSSNEEEKKPTAIVVRKLTYPAKKVKSKQAVRKIVNIQPKILTGNVIHVATQEDSNMEIGDEAAVFGQDPGSGGDADEPVGQGNPALGQANPAVGQAIAVGQANPAVSPLKLGGQTSGQLNPAISQDNQVVGQTNPSGGHTNQGIGQMNTSVPVAVQPFQAMVQNETNMQQSTGGLPVVSPVAYTSTHSSPTPGSSTLQSAGVPLSGVSPQGAVLPQGGHPGVAPVAYTSTHSSPTPGSNTVQPAGVPLSGVSHQGTVFTHGGQPGVAPVAYTSTHSSPTPGNNAVQPAGVTLSTVSPQSTVLTQGGHPPVAPVAYTSTHSSPTPGNNAVQPAGVTLSTVSPQGGHPAVAPVAYTSTHSSPTPGNNAVQPAGVPLSTVSPQGTVLTQGGHPPVAPVVYTSTHSSPTPGSSTLQSVPLSGISPQSTVLPQGGHPGVAPVAYTSTHSSPTPGSSTLQSAGVPLSGVSPQGTVVAPSNTAASQQPVYITISSNQLNTGFQNRLPLNPQPRPPAKPINVGTAYQQVYASMPAPVIRFQQPAIFIAAPQSTTPVTVPSLIVQEKKKVSRQAGVNRQQKQALVWIRHWMKAILNISFPFYRPMPTMTIWRRLRLKSTQRGRIITEKVIRLKLQYLMISQVHQLLERKSAYQRILFQKTTSESGDKTGAAEQLNTANETEVPVHVESIQDSQEPQTEAGVADQKLKKQPDLMESKGTQIDPKAMQAEEQVQQATRKESDTQTDPDMPTSADPSDIPQEATKLLQSCVTSPLARSQVQTQAIQTPSPPIQALEQARTPTYVQSPIPAVNQSITVPNSNITFHSPPVSNFPPQLSVVKDSSNTPSPASSVASHKSPKGISALRNFKIDQGAVARQSPALSPVPQNKPKTARKLIQGEITSSPPHTKSTSSSATSVVSDNQTQPMVENMVCQNQSASQEFIRATDATIDSQVLQSGTKLESPGDSGKSKRSSPSENLLCKELELSDDELKPLSKEEEEFYEEEPMEEDQEEDVEAIEDGAAKQNSPPCEENTTTNPSEIVSPSASEKSTHSNVCTPPSDKASSKEPSPSAKLATGEDPQSPETEDALTSPEMKTKGDGERRSSVTFEDSNSMDAGSNPHTNDGYEEGGEEDAENDDLNPAKIGSGKKKKSRSKRIAAKRIKTKLKKDLESTVVLLDPEIVSKDPLREERDDSFSKAYLKSVKEALKDDLPKYIEFLRVLNNFTDEEEPDMVKLYYNVCAVLADHTDLIEEFTAFLPQEVASQCGVLIPNLEFAKARLFLRQVEVHFSKQPTHFQKILSLIIEWGSNEERTNQQLKDLILPQLNSQPHLKQEFSLLFPDNIPPESHMMDFEYITLGDDNKKYDSFEEIEVSDSEEEKPIRIEPVPAKQNTKKRKRSDARKKRTKGGVIDPWKGLNAELQYGTHSCKCNCHDVSLDLRVQRKVRHCAYCTAGVSRAELISTLKGLKTPSRRPIGKSQLDMFDDNSNSIDGPGGMLASRGSDRRPRGKMRSAKRKKNDSEDDGEDEEEEAERQRAVSHLSQMCDSLANTLNEHGNTSDDEDEEDLEKYTEDEKEWDEEEKETEYEKETEDEKESCDDKESDDEKETEDEDHDDDEEEEMEEDHDDDDIDDDVEDDLMDVDDGVETGEDAEDEEEEEDDEDEDEDVDKDIHKEEEIGAISGESHDAVTNSPYATSQESHSGESDSSNPASPHTPLSECEQKPTKSDIQEETSRDSESKDAASENVVETRQEHLSQASQISEQKTTDERVPAEDLERLNVNKVVPAENLERLNVNKGALTENPNLQQKSGDLEDANHRNVLPVTKNVTKDGACTSNYQMGVKDNTGTDKVALDKDTGAKMHERTVETDKLPERFDTKDKISEESSEEAVSLGKKDSDEVPARIDESGDDQRKEQDSGVDGKRIMPPKPDDGEEDAREEEKDVVDKDATPDETAEADDGKELNTSIIWTREEDRLLLQSCQLRDPTKILFTEIAEKLQDKTPEQVSSRFNILMQIFNSSQDEDDDDDADDDDDDEADDVEEDGDDEDESEEEAD